MAENVLSTDYKYFPAIIVAICVGGILVLVLIMWITKCIVRRKPSKRNERASYYPPDFYTGANQRSADMITNDNKSKYDIENQSQIPLAPPLPRLRTNSSALPRPQSLYTNSQYARPQSSNLDLDDFVAPLFDQQQLQQYRMNNESNGHSDSNGHYTSNSTDKLSSDKL